MSAAEHVVQLLGGAADVDDDAVVVEPVAPERRVDDEGRAVQPLRRSEDLTPEAVRDHHVVADGHAEHAVTPSLVGDGVAQRGQIPAPGAP